MHLQLNLLLASKDLMTIHDMHHFNFLFGISNVVIIYERQLIYCNLYMII